MHVYSIEVLSFINLRVYVRMYVCKYMSIYMYVFIITLCAININTVCVHRQYVRTYMHE